MRRATAVVLLLAAVVLPGVAQGKAKVLPVFGAHSRTAWRAPAGSGSADAVLRSAPTPLLEARWNSERLARQQLGAHGISRKGEKLRQLRLQRRQPGSAVEPELLRILLIRIAFEEDRSGTLTSITEDGNFQLEPDTTIQFDPPPRNRSYFEAHLDGLAQFWGSMSGGTLEIDARVLPEGENDAYFLSDIADYGPGSGGFWTVDLLEKLVRDMILKADEETRKDGSANLADYDFDNPNTYIIFAHAGADIQSNLVWTPGDPDYSPNDIPTFFVALGDEARVPLGSIDSTTGTQGLITECSVIPETTSQDGLIGSIAAALYHEFGHALGLPDLYSTITGLPTVGFWDIMDTGTNLTAVVLVEDEQGMLVPEFVTGLLPPQTSIWCKWYLGFVDEVRAGGGERELTIWPTHQQPQRQKALRIDVSPNEFFLVSNRWVPATGGPNWALISDPATGVVQYLGIAEGDPPFENTHQYDFFMPWGGGVMIWRVRQDRVEEGMAFNRVQGLPSRLGIELVEADGIQDIGVFEFTTRGFLGSENDAFRDLTEFEGSEPYPRTAVEFTPSSVPESRSSLRMPTGVRLTGIGPSQNGPISLRASIDGVLDSGRPDVFPIELPVRSAGDGREVVVRGEPQSLGLFPFSRGLGIILAAQSSDEAESPGLYVYGFDGAALFGGDPRLLDLQAPLAGPPVWATDFRAPAADALVTVSTDGSVNFLGPDGLADGLASVFSDSVDSRPIVLRDGAASFVVAAHLQNSRIQVMDSTGRDHPDWSDAFGLGPSNDLRSAPIAADLSGDGETDVLVYATSRGFDARLVSGGPVGAGRALDGDEFPLAYPDGFRFDDPGERGWVVAWPADEADAPDRLLFLSEGLRVVIAEHRSGAGWSTRFFGGRLDSKVVGEPAVADVDGDGKLDLIVTTARRVWARNSAGVDLFGYPINLEDQYLIRESRPDSLSSSAVVADVDGDDLNEILVVSSFGLLHAFDASGRNVPGYPQKYSGGGASGPLLADVDRPGQKRRMLLFFEALGDTLASARRARSARLNVADLAEAPDRSPRPAEWWGLGGGAQRPHRGARGAPSTNTGPAEQLQARRPLVYPNPAGVHGDLVLVRFYSAAEQTARLTVFTLEGEQVFGTSAESAAGQTAEITWSSRGLAPGPYLCRLDYVGAQGADTALMTLYIER